MRKIIQETQTATSTPNGRAWLDLASIASAELTSEDSRYPIENALQDGSTEGFRASASGTQSIRLTFDHPQAIQRIRLEFHEETARRSQEFAVFTTSVGESRREFVRQQWIFSPEGSRDEVEEYTADLKNVVTFELVVDPGRHDQSAVVTLKAIRIA